MRSLRAYSVHAGCGARHRNPRHHHSDDDRLLSDAYAARTSVSDRRKTARRNAGISLPRIQAARAVRINNNYYHFASAAVAVYSSHMTAPSSASWSRFSTSSNFVNGHVSTMWFMVCRWTQSPVIMPRPIC